ncbi:neuronal pentraxin-2-like [Oculina patagonica]
MVPLVDNLWHHICVSWENVQGLWDVIVNGAVVAHGSAWRKTLTVRPGKLIVGGIFYDSDIFAAKVAYFNIWNTKKSNSEIIEMARSCSQEFGNVIDWRMFRHGIHGDAEIRSPQSCISHVAESEFVLDFPAREVASYLETPTLPTIEKFTFCFWMKRDFDGKLYAGIIAYATTQEVRSLEVTIGGAGALNLHIMASMYVIQ